MGRTGATRRRIPVRVETPEQALINARLQAERNALWFGVFSAVVSLGVLLFIFTGRHLLEGPPVAVYGAAPIVLGAEVYLLTRPKAPPRARKQPALGSIESLHQHHD